MGDLLDFRTSKNRKNDKINFVFIKESSRISKNRKTIIQKQKNRFGACVVNRFWSIILPLSRNVAGQKFEEQDMRRKNLSSAGVLSRLMAAAVFPILAAACDRASDEPASYGELRLGFHEADYRSTRSSVEIPDTNDFILSVTDQSGNVIYSGPYGASPEVMQVPEGSYDISVRSSEFLRPAFSVPQFGDDKCVVVPAGGAVNVRLECVQVNSGIRLLISSGFLDAYPEGVLFVKSDDGSLMYGYSEKRIAYFNPGNVSLVLSNGGTDKTLCTRTLESREILVLGVQVASAPESSAGAISITVDTSRVWTADEFVIGGDGGESSGGSAEDAVSVNRARDMIGEKDVWVTGYIVGGDLTRTSVSFSPPFDSATNLAIAARSSASSRESCLSVELPAGDVRDALNLPAHPDLIGRQVFLCGDIAESYFGLVGIKGVNDFVLK